MLHTFPKKKSSDKLRRGGRNRLGKMNTFGGEASGGITDLRMRESVIWPSLVKNDYFLLRNPVY
jgi:hypothetical protein